MPLGAFQPPKPAPGGPATVFPLGRYIYILGWRREEKLNLIRTINPEFKDFAQSCDGR
jgi:hypothetical protein